MQTFRNALHRLLTWLAEPEYRSDQSPARGDWADLPVHHPRQG